MKNEITQVRLPRQLLESLQHLFEADFSDVEICIDPQLDHTKVRAMAFGRTLVFAPQSFGLTTWEGLYLLGHELAHLVQQANGAVRANSAKKGIFFCTDEELEKDAEKMGRLVADHLSGTFQEGEITKSARPVIKAGDICQFEIGPNAIVGDFVIDKWGIVYEIIRKFGLGEGESYEINYDIEYKPNGYYIYKQVTANNPNYTLEGNIPPSPPPIPPLPEPIQEGEETIEANFPEGDVPQVISDVAEIEAENDEDLFPYVYMRNWPQPTAEEKLDYFIFYNSAEGYYMSSPPGGATLYEQLLAAKTVDDAEQAALKFINSSPEYLGNLLDPQESERIVNAYYQLRKLIEKEGCDRESFLGQKETFFKQPMIHNLTVLFPNLLDVFWQNYFALIIISGYRPDLRSCITVLIILYNLQSIIDRSLKGAITLEQLQLLMAASPVLPKALFPLSETKKAKTATPYPTNPSDEWVEPYAIGELQMVKQKFKEYRLGEIARIINIMAGEKQEITNRSMNRHQTVDGEQTDSQDQHVHTDQERSFSLEEEAQQMIQSQVNYGNGNSGNNGTNNGGGSGFQATYGPLTTVTLNGQWTINTKPLEKDKPSEQKAAFARAVLNKSLTNLNKKVARLRQTTVVRESEEKSVSLIDNSGQKWPTRAIYHWVNKIYDAWVINYGNRFLIEFSVYKPAAYYIANTYELEGQSLKEPTPPGEIGLNTFQDIILYTPPKSKTDSTTSNSNLYYAQLYARYDVKNILLPPAEKKTVSGVLSAGESVSINIPDNYKAGNAYLSFYIPESLKDLTWNILIGDKHQEIKNETSSKQPIKIELDKSYDTVPVAFFRQTISSPPALEEEVYVTIVIDCLPQDSLINEIKLEMYQAIMAAYESQRTAYFSRVNLNTNPSEANNPLMTRQIQQRELIRSCIRVLLAVWDRMNPESEKSQELPHQRQVNRPRYRQFLEHLFEWPELTYSFDQIFHNTDTISKKSIQQYQSAGYGEPFTDFLHAEHAQIIVPVRKGHELATLYFLNSGQVWDGPGIFCPILEDNLSIALDLKKSMQVNSPSGTEPIQWELKVPTVMQYLSDNDNLSPNIETKSNFDE